MKMVRRTGEIRTFCVTLAGSLALSSGQGELKSFKQGYDGVRS